MTAVRWLLLVFFSFCIQYLKCEIKLVNVIIWLWCIKSLMHWETLSTSTVCVCVCVLFVSPVTFGLSVVFQDGCPYYTPLNGILPSGEISSKNFGLICYFLFVCYLFIYIFSACSKFSLFSRSQFFSFVYTYSAITYGYLAI